MPLLAAVAIIPATAVVCAASGLSLAAVLGVTAAVAVAGAVLAHRTLGNLAAGVALLLIRPYAPGERVRLNAPQRGGAVEAVLVRIGVANSVLATETGLLVVANKMLLKGVPAPAGG